MIDNPKSASLLLKNGSLIRVMSMGCVDSGAVARIVVPNPPAADDVATWRVLLVRLTRVSFGSYASDMATWIEHAHFKRTDGSVLSAGGGENPLFDIAVESTAYAIGNVVTLSYTYN